MKDMTSLEELIFAQIYSAKYNEEQTNSCPGEEAAKRAYNYATDAVIDLRIIQELTH